MYRSVYGFVMLIQFILLQLMDIDSATLFALRKRSDVKRGRHPTWRHFTTEF